MSNNNILKFIVAIEDQATKGLDEIERRLNSMVDYFKTSTTNINKILGGIGGKENAQSVENFTKTLSEVQASLKKNVGEVPLFKSVMEQMMQLQKFIGSNSLKEEIEKVRTSINSLFIEVPKVNPGAFNTYFQELNKAYEAFREKLSGGKNMNLTEGLGADVSRLGSISGGGTYKDMQAQVDAVKLALLKSMKEINEAINVTKGLLSNNGINFGKVSEKVEKLTANIDVLATAFRNLNGVIKDEKLLNTAAGIGEAIRSVRGSVKALQEGSANMRVKEDFDEAVKSIYRARAEIERLIPLQEKLQRQIDMAKILGLDSEKIEKAQAEMLRLREILSSITRSSNGLANGKDVHRDNLTGLNTSQLMMAYSNDVIRAKNALATQTQKNSEALKNETQAQKENEKALLREKESAIEAAKSIYRARAEWQRLAPVIEKIGKQVDITRSLGLDDKSITKAEAEITRLRAMLLSIAESPKGLLHKSDVGDLPHLAGANASQLMEAYKDKVIEAKNTLTAQMQRNKEALKNETQAQKENEIAKRSNSQATEALIQKENQLSNAIEKATGRRREHSQVISDLKSMALQYLSVWGAQQFVTDMANITGELELQRKSLEVILDNASAAQKMYSEIRDLSQMSPYTFEDLLKSHRQLAAFGVEAKDTFNTLKSLSDIGAGLDVDVSRLILAYGHTKSYGYLSGIQNRQFETAGIDLVGALSAMYNKRANERKREGKQYEFVNRKDIFQRMRTRSIPFEDVQEVILDLDKPGGKFYNMQIRQFETLGGKLRNLRNNYRIMMSELGEDNKGFLMGMVGFINELTENWQRYVNILKGVAVGYGAVKLAALLAGRQAMFTSKELVSASVLRNRLSGATSYLNGNISMWGAMGSSRKIRHPKSSLALEQNDNIIKNIATNEKINTLTKQRIALTSALTKEQRILLLTETGINQARATQIAGMSVWQRRFLALRLGIIGVAQSFKAMAVAMLTNPITWIATAIGAVTWLVNKMGQASEEAENFKNNLSEAAETDVKGMKEFLDPYKQSGMVKTIGKTAVKGDGRTAIHETIDINKAELEAEGIDTVFEELKNKLQTASPMYEGDYFDVMKAEGQADQVKGMFQKMEDIKFAKQIEQQTSDKLSRAVQKTGGWYDWFTEGIITNMSDYAKDRVDFVNSIRVSDDQWNSFSKEDRAAIEKYMRELGMARNEAIAKYLLQSKNKTLSRSIFGSSKDNVFEDIESSLKTVKSDIAPVAANMAQILVNNFGDNISAGSAYITDAFNKMLSDAKVGSPETQAELAAEFNESILTSLGAMGKGSYGVALMKHLYQNEIGKMTLTDLDTSLRQDMSEEVVAKTAKQSVRKMIESLKLKDPAFLKFFKSLGKKSQEEYVKGIEEAAVSVGKDKVKSILWQQFYIDRGVSVNKDTDTDYIDFVKKQHEELANGLKRIMSQKKHLKDVFHIDVDIDLNSKDAVRKLRKYILALNHQLHDKWIEHNASSGAKRTKLMSDIYYVKYMRHQAVGLYQIAKALQEDHQPLTDEGSGNRGNSFDHSGRKNHSSRGSGSYKDPFVSRWDERIRVMKEANNEYEDWEKRISKKGAIERVRKQFGGIFESWKKDKVLPMNFKIEDVGDIRKYVENIRQQALERYKKQKGSKRYNHGEEALRVYRQAQEVLNSIDKKVFDRATELWASKTSLWLDRLTKKWELYQKVLKATGDIQLSMSLSGFNTEKYQSVADAIKEKIGKDLQDAGMKGGFIFDKDASDKQIEESVKDSLGYKEGDKDASKEERIKGIVEELKKWRDLQRQIEDEGKETYATIIGGIDNYLNRIQKANSEYEDLLRKMEKAKNAGALSEAQFQRGVQIAADKRDRATYEASAPYRRLIGSTLTNSSRLAHVEGDRAIRLLMEQFNRGSISADEYTKKIKEINDALDKTDRNKVSGIVRFFNETPEQRHTRKADEAMERFTDATNEYEQYQGIRDKALANGDRYTAINAGVAMARAQARQEAALGDANGEREKSIKSKKFAGAIDTATKALHGFQSSMDLLSKTFAALGMLGGAEGTSDAADIAGSMFQGATSLSSLGPYGMAAGAVLGLITSVAGLHDKELERQIGEMKDDVANIESYTEAISRAQERTLGYDRGNELRRLGQRYIENDSIFDNLHLNTSRAADDAMKEFYGVAAGTGNSYQQQFELLKRERQDYIDMYNLKYEEKGDHKQDLLEYRKKIAELDDKLLHFVEDTAKNLWGIDVKGWADQVSDAICNAFENGEDAAKAFKDTAEDILRSVANNIIKMGVIQPMFEKLNRKLFGYDDEDGNYNAGLIDIHDEHAFDDPDKLAKIILGGTAQFLNNDFKNMQTTAHQVYTGINRLVESSGYSLKKSKDGGNSTLSSGIQGMSENTAGLLAGYVNALRQDVSYIRLIQTTFTNEIWKDYIQQVTGMGGALMRIDENVAAIRSVISENGSLYQKIEQMAGDLHNVIFGNERVRVE